MNQHHPLITAQFLENPQAKRDEIYGDARTAILNQTALEVARQAITAWPSYSPTPLHSLPALAGQLQIASLHYKDEGSRFGLGSFKALGGAYAVGRQICRVLTQRLGRAIDIQDLQDPALKEPISQITVTCATDGNHGRSVAWGAKMFGCRCVIFIHATVSDGRRDAIAHFGAEVIRTQGNYDESVREADHYAKEHGCYVISDTSYPGYMDVPRDVMQGYQLMVDEAAGQIPQRPTHIFVQAGVGGFAAAVCAYFWERDGTKRPRFIVVEPDKADCLYQSAFNQKLTAVHGDLDTLMAGLACGEVSLLAWQILEQGADAFAVIPDEAAVTVMRTLAQPEGNDPAIVAGESAVAGLAAAMAAAQQPEMREALGIDANSRFLFFGSEADTDPQLYTQLVGANSAAVLAAAHI